MTPFLPCMRVAGDAALTSRLSDRFFAKLARLGQRHRTDPAFFLVAWALESNLDPHVVNRIGARGLNQMMPATLRGLGAPMNFEQLSGDEQLLWIEKLITAAEAQIGGPFESAARYYHSNLYPGTLGRGSSPTAVVLSRDAGDARERAAYESNKGLDLNGDGQIALGDIAAVLERVARRANVQDALARLDAAARKLPAPGATWRGGEQRARSSSRHRLALGVGLAAGAVGLVAWRGR